MEFNPIDHPICLSAPDFMSNSTPWHGHMPFGMTLTDILRPSQIVELGVYCGDSFFAFCQSARILKLSGSIEITGIDTFEGDPSMGGYDGDSIKATVASRIQSYYPDFARLIIDTFDKALDTFPDGSIDLIHHDGDHSYDAVRHDFNSWLPKLSPTGIWIMHDTQATFVTETNTLVDGSSIFWKELVAQYPGRTFEFTHSHGLGLLAPNDFPSNTIEWFCQNASTLSGDRVRHFFSLLAARVTAAHTQRRMLYKQTDLVP